MTVQVFAPLLFSPVKISGQSVPRHSSLSEPDPQLQRDRQAASAESDRNWQTQMMLFERRVAAAQESGSDPGTEPAGAAGTQCFCPADQRQWGLCSHQSRSAETRRATVGGAELS